MRVFVTGATGFIGSAVVKELIQHGHQVLGLSRSEEKAAALKAAGADAQIGLLEDLAGLKTGVEACDGVIHLAFNHDFSRFQKNCEDDRKAIEALGLAVTGTAKPMLVTSGTAIANAGPGQLAMENAPAVRADIHPRAASEMRVADMVANGANISIIRLPQVHDQARQGLVSPAIALFREKGVCVYFGEGHNRWPAAHVSDVARLYCLALEKAEPGAKYHAVAEEGVAMREIVQTIGARLQLPVKSIPLEDAPGFFGWLAMFASLDMPASGTWTQEHLGWKPAGPKLISDLKHLRLENV